MDHEQAPNVPDATQPESQIDSGQLVYFQPNADGSTQLAERFDETGAHIDPQSGYWPSINQDDRRMILEVEASDGQIDTKYIKDNCLYEKVNERLVRTPLNNFTGITIGEGAEIFPRGSTVNRAFVGLGVVASQKEAEKLFGIEEEPSNPFYEFDPSGKQVYFQPNADGSTQLAERFDLSGTHIDLEMGFWTRLNEPARKGERRIIIETEGADGQTNIKYVKGNYMYEIADERLVRTPLFSGERKRSAFSNLTIGQGSALFPPGSKIKSVFVAHGVVASQEEAKNFGVQVQEEFSNVFSVFDQNAPKLDKALENQEKAAQARRPLMDLGPEPQFRFAEGATKKVHEVRQGDKVLTTLLDEEERKKQGMGYTDEQREALRYHGEFDKLREDDAVHAAYRVKRKREGWENEKSWGLIKAARLAIGLTLRGGRGTVSNSPAVDEPETPAAEAPTEELSTEEPVTEEMVTEEMVEGQPEIKSARGRLAEARRRGRMSNTKEPVQFRQMSDEEMQRQWAARMIMAREFEDIMAEDEPEKAEWSYQSSPKKQPPKRNNSQNKAPKPKNRPRRKRS